MVIDELTVRTFSTVILFPLSSHTTLNVRLNILWNTSQTFPELKFILKPFSTREGMIRLAFVYTTHIILLALDTNICGIFEGKRSDSKHQSLLRK